MKTGDEIIYHCTTIVSLIGNGFADTHAPSQPTKPDPVNRPSHYTAGGVEVIDAIEAWGLGFALGNAVKYIARAGKKDPSKTIEDLRKARWYLDREIVLHERKKP